jgi:hypothetical protein
MSLFGFFKKDKIENENKSKPFHANKNATDRRDWFSRTRPWHKVSPLIIDALIDKFGDNPMFEVFVVTSMTDGLVSHYETLGETEISTTPSVVLPQISKILFSKGADAAQTLEQLLKGGGSDRKVDSLYATALNCLETSVILSDHMVHSYVILAKLRILSGNLEDANGFIESGLIEIQKIKENYDVFSKSKLDSIKEMPQNYDEIEQILLSMKKEI